ncbi:TlpA family protein disulfide reductase [Thalassotalea algicola]|nr:TlpA disulfide reductase family protein [Thalassotalea algicola]
MIKNLSIQIFVFFCIFQAMSFLRETSMLSTDTQVNEGLVLPTLNNEFQSISAQGKPLVIYFFAPWCQICHMSISNLQSTFEKNSNIDVIAIAMDFTDKEEVNKFVARHKLTFPIALGKESLKNEFQITGYPSYYVINEQNLITSKSLGYSTELGLYLRSL